MDTEQAGHPAGHSLSRVLDYQSNTLFTADRVTGQYYTESLNTQALRRELFPLAGPNLTNAGPRGGSIAGMGPAGMPVSTGNHWPGSGKFLLLQAGGPQRGEDGTSAGAQRLFKLEKLGRATIAGVRSVHLRLTTEVRPGNCADLKSGTEVIDLWVASRLPALDFQPTPTPAPASPQHNSAPDEVEDPAFARPTPQLTPGVDPTPGPAPEEDAVPSATAPSEVEPESPATEPVTKPPVLPRAGFQLSQFPAETPQNPPSTTPAPSLGTPLAPAARPTPLPYPTPYPGPIPEGLIGPLGRGNLDPSACDVEDFRAGNLREFERLFQGLILRVRVFRGKKVVLEQEVTSVEETELDKALFGTGELRQVSREEFWANRTRELASPAPTPAPQTTPFRP